MSLEEKVADLERRVMTLEAARISPRKAPSLGQSSGEMKSSEQEFADAPTYDHNIMFSGSVHLPTNERYEWQAHFATDDLLTDARDDEVATCLAALGNTVRLQLIREIIGGRRTVTELTEVDGLGTSGQIYHHLRQLVAAGWLRTAGRGRFEVPPARLVPLLVALASTRQSQTPGEAR
ncbi:ArsR/SmtB family transcription factor [Nocardia sp. NPDC088792]|uniref:ArsR/SmtB family transcription factor n=1 Tax=Nocardia sp. NPDC088792 TaxID=3364332 RepID=UPI0037F4E1FD